jgi:hypothetical protein
LTHTVELGRPVALPSQPMPSRHSTERGSAGSKSVNTISLRLTRRYRARYRAYPGREFRAELDGPWIIVSTDTTTNALACFENHYFQSGVAKFSGGCKPGYTRSNNCCVSVEHTTEQDYSIFMLNRIRKS